MPTTVLRLTNRNANLRALFEETGRELAAGGGVQFSVSTEGTVRDLHPRRRLISAR